MKTKYIFFILAFVITIPSAYCQNTRFDISAQVIPRELCPTCPSSTILAGSLVEIAVTVKPDPLSESWNYLPATTFKPDWLDISFYESANSSQKAVSINHAYFVSAYTRTIDQMVADGKDNPPKPDPYRVYKFAFTVPELVDSILCVRVTLHNPPYGPIVLNDIFDEHFKCLHVLQPRNRADSTYVFETHVDHYWNSGDLDRCVTLADSLIQHGWVAGVLSARLSATHLNRLDELLRIMDAAYETYGTIYNYPRRMTRMDATEYQSMRNDLLRKIEEQQKSDH
ncbi:hypothetical protein HUU59_05870 [bacterium]|nr:hypothetical protein [bacterium]